MSLLQTAKEKPFYVAGVVAALVMLSQFDKGLGLLWSKWNADVLASEAKQAATSVRSDFDRYIESERQAQTLEQQRIQMQQEFNEEIMKLQQQYQQQAVPNAPAQFMTPPIPIVEQDASGQWWCCWEQSTDACWAHESWVRCE